MPVRYLESRGLHGAWGTIVMTLGVTVVLALWIIVSGRPLRLRSRALLGAVLAGFAVAMFSAALNDAEVIRVILLFYLAPGWSKIIEWGFMGRAWRWSSTLALMAFFSGAILILDGGVSFSGIGYGDILAVLAGVAWAIGSALIFTGEKQHYTVLTLATAIVATFVGLGLVGFSGWPVLGGEAVTVLASGAALGIIYVTPILAATMWSAQYLPPATLNFLLTGEILSGVISGALLLDEPFGVLQISGALLIIVGVCIEALPSLYRLRRR